MSSWYELDIAVNILKNFDLTVMQCSSIYPCPPTKVGLNILGEMRERYGTRIGFSDHTDGFSASIASVVLGATVIEKHFSFSKFMYGSDALHSMEPNQFKQFCSEIYNVSLMHNNLIDKNEMSDYLDMKKIFEKSIVSKTKIEKMLRTFEICIKTWQWYSSG